MKLRMIIRLVLILGFFIYFMFCGDENDQVHIEKDPHAHIKTTDDITRYVTKMTGAMACPMDSIGGYSYNTSSDKRKISFLKVSNASLNNNLIKTSEEASSTFSIDVDTASYTRFKSMIEYEEIDKDSIRTEEFINYFTYDYPQPKKNKPFSVITEVGPSILNKDRHIIHIGIQGRKKADEKRKAANLVFLIDTSGSMSSYNKLPLLKKSLNILTNNLTEKDSITIVTYAGSSSVALKPTSGNNKNKIIEAINKLGANGGTNGEGGILTAYKKAKKNYSKNKINRIILCTDGDFNIGVYNVDKLKRLVKEKRKSGITLSTIGFGMGNYNDDIMETLADNGNGNYFYINNVKEAKKVFSKELTANLEVIAKDVKIQVEFNPKHVESYKLIGYKNRILKNEDFKNDKIDAGEIGSGHTVTALYEITLTDNSSAPLSDLRYKKAHKKTNVMVGSHAYQELAHVKLRHKSPNGKRSKLSSYPILKKNIIKDINKTSNNFRFSSAVAAFTLNLINENDLDMENKNEINISNEEIVKIAENSKGSDEFGYRKEFIELTKKLNIIKTKLINKVDYNIEGITLSIPSFTKNINKKIIERALFRKSKSFKYCKDNSLQENPELRGTVVFKWIISKEGKKKDLIIKKDTTNDQELLSCLKRMISIIELPPTSDQKDFVAILELNFSNYDEIKIP